MYTAHLYHTVFDGLAVVLALGGGWLVYKWRFQTILPETTAKIGAGYFVSLSSGSLTGAYLFGTLNLYISGIPEIGRSILGAVFGATCMVELYKSRRGMVGSTGYIFVVPFTVIVVVGRIGCFLSGLDDQTYGVKTNLPWGWDYGDHIMRHPVQLYESFAMLGFLACVIVLLKFRPQIIIRYGFYLCIGFYALQRFAWEFLKPYADVIGPLNLFQLVCLIILLYSLFMIVMARHDYQTA